MKIAKKCLINRADQGIITIEVAKRFLFNKKNKKMDDEDCVKVPV
jgi:hypothetical protein